jgi:hypothetical protein
MISLLACLLLKFVSMFTCVHTINTATTVHSRTPATGALLYLLRCCAQRTPWAGLGDDPSEDIRALFATLINASSNEIAIW